MTPHHALLYKIAELGSQRAAADYFACSEGYISRIANGHSAVPDWIALKLGFVRKWEKSDGVDS